MLARELTPGKISDPRKRQRVDFSNLAHAMEYRGDVRLALWQKTAPKWSGKTSSSSSLAIIGWPTHARVGLATIPLSAVTRDPTLLGKGDPDDVVLARASLPESVFEALEERYGYRPDLHRQELGWWFFDGKSVPKTVPSSRSAVALLPSTVTNSRDALVLVDIDDRWAVLSEVALRVYDVGAALDDKRPVQFVRWQSGRRIIWDVELAQSIPHSVVKARFGKEAASRARPDARSIVVRRTHA